MKRITILTIMIMMSIASFAQGPQGKNRKFVYVNDYKDIRIWSEVYCAREIRYDTYNDSTKMHGSFVQPFDAQGNPLQIGTCYLQWDGDIIPTLPFWLGTYIYDLSELEVIVTGWLYYKDKYGNSDVMYILYARPKGTNYYIKNKKKTN